MGAASTTATETKVAVSPVQQYTTDAHLRPSIPSRRRLSESWSTSSSPGRYSLPPSCHQRPLSHSVDALDLPFPSYTPTLASLRLHILDCLADLESRLSLFDSPISADSIKAKGELTIEEARAWARDGLMMLRSIREDVRSQLPDIFTTDSIPFMEEFVHKHMPDVPTFPHMRAHLQDVPDAVRSRLPAFTFSDVRSRLDDVRHRISDIDFNKPLYFIPILSVRLQDLHAHISSMDFELTSATHLSPSATLSTLIDKIISSDLVSEISSEFRSGEETLERAASEIAQAMKRSLNGSRLIQYVDLPDRWKNNHFVKGGYRFIPLHDWPRLILSLFALHNETLNIHTHLIPFIFWSYAWFRFSPTYDVSDNYEPAKVAFTTFALLCLFTSVVWHTMAGCAHPTGMEFCARVDYVGIGWLISASVGTVVYYGFQCQSNTRHAFLLLCAGIGVSGSIVPFTDWFNKREYKSWRIAFFLTLALSSIAPLVELSRLHSFMNMLKFILPIVPSLTSYIVGLVFYATHFPECVLATRWPSLHWLDWLGGGSHAIWHVCIVYAISLHKDGMEYMTDGFGQCVA